MQLRGAIGKCWYRPGKYLAWGQSQPLGGTQYNDILSKILEILQAFIDSVSS